MRMIKFMIPLAIALILCASAQAEEGKSGSWKGTLAPREADAKEGVVAVLTLNSKNKDEGKKLNLWADGEIAKKIGDLVAKSSYAEVKGTETADGVKVTSIKEKTK